LLARVELDVEPDNDHPTLIKPVKPAAA